MASAVRKPGISDPVASARIPVTSGANTDALIPKKLKIPKVVVMRAGLVRAPSHEMMRGSTASFPKKPYATAPIATMGALCPKTSGSSASAAAASSATIRAICRLGCRSAIRPATSAPGMPARKTAMLAAPANEASNARSTCRKSGSQVLIR